MGFSRCHSTSHAKCPAADNSKQFTDATTVELCLSLSSENAVKTQTWCHRRLCPDRRHRERNSNSTPTYYFVCLLNRFHPRGLKHRTEAQSLQAIFLWFLVGQKLRLGNRQMCT